MTMLNYMGQRPTCPKCECATVAGPKYAAATDLVAEGLLRSCTGCGYAWSEHCADDPTGLTAKPLPPTPTPKPAPTTAPVDTPA